jgi:hypothetical protein
LLPEGGNFLPGKAVFIALGAKRDILGEGFFDLARKFSTWGGNFRLNVGNSLHDEGNLLPGEGRSSLWGGNAAVVLADLLFHKTS